MAKIQEEILEAFFVRLNESEAVDDQMIDGLRALMSPDNKLNSEKIIEVFTVDFASDGGP